MTPEQIARLAHLHKKDESSEPSSTSPLTNAELEEMHALEDLEESDQLPENGSASAP